MSIMEEATAQLARQNASALDMLICTGLLNTLRESPEPMTSRQLAQLWTEECGLDADEGTINAMRRRVGSCIKESVKQGLVETVGQTTDHDPNGPYKLWRVKKT